MKHRTIASLVCVAAMLMGINSCSCNSTQQSAPSKAGLTLETIDPTLNHTARFFAGLPQEAGSPLAEVTSQPEYKAYASQIDTGWNNTQAKNLAKISEWRKANLTQTFTDTILYPFSGPDMLNVLAFLPDGTDYVLFGLEKPGIVHNPAQTDRAKMYRDLGLLKNSLGDIMHLNFFKTIGMEAELRQDSFNSVSGIILFFLSRSGYDVLAGKNISITPEGTLQDGLDLKNPNLIPGIEFYFRKQGSDRIQRVRYFSLNIINSQLATHPNMPAFLRKLGPCTTMMKSASFLLHADEYFSKTRELLLEVSAFILQDDSGVPLKYVLSAPETWEVTYWGVYDQPIPLFANRFQPELLKNMKEYSKGVLPFSYGYDYSPGQSNLMLFTRKSGADTK